MVYDSIIVGKGPAGISAALYLKSGNLDILVIGKDGGTLEKVRNIDNYYGFDKTINGEELLKNGLKQASRLGIEIEKDEVIGVELKDNKFKVKTRNNEFNSKTLIIATGANRKTPDILGLEEFEGKGISYCAVCDSFFYRNKNVSVVGSGDYAIEEAKVLLPIAKSVSILTNGEKIIENRGIDFDKIGIIEEKIDEFKGTTKLEKVKFSSGKNLKTDGVFIAVGVASSTDLARKLGAIIRENNILVDSDMATNVPGLYACGDCTGGLLQISKAVYEGAKAGLSCIKFIKDNK